MNNINEFTKDVFEKWGLWQERRIIDEYYLINGESLNQVMFRLNCDYAHVCKLFKMFGLERRSNDYDPTLKIG